MPEFDADAFILKLALWTVSGASLIKYGELFYWGCASRARFSASDGYYYLFDDDTHHVLGVFFSRRNKTIFEECRKHQRIQVIKFRV